MADSFGLDLICFGGLISFLGMCISYCSIAVKRTHDHGNCYKRKYLIGGLLQFRVLVHYRHYVALDYLNVM